MRLSTLLLPCAAYVAGSLPMGLWIGRMRGIDLRLHGSGNIGATNAGRVLGQPWFYIVFALDFAKSFVPVEIARRLPDVDVDRSWFSLACGLAAVLGHVFPIFLRFRGGKGVATASGVFAAVAPVPTAVALVVWLAFFLPTRLVSLASLVAAWSLPLACLLLPRVTRIEVGNGVLSAAIAVALLITLRHRANIVRLLRGEEPRIRSGERD